MGAGLAFIALGPERRHIVGARNGVIHERPAHGLPASVIGASLEKRLPDPLGEPAVDLGLDDHRIDDGADIVHRPKSDDFGAAGVGVDLDLAEMRAVAEGKARRIVNRGLLQAGLERFERKIMRHVSRLRDRRERDTPVGTGHEECAAAEVDIARGRLEQVTSDQLSFGDDLVGSAIERAAADRDRSRAKSAGAVGYRIGIALDHLDVLDRNPKSRGEDLSKRGGVTLAVIVGSEHRPHGAVGFDPDRCRLIEADTSTQRAGKTRRRDPRGLDVAGHADPA